MDTSGYYSLQPLFDYVKSVPRLPRRDKIELSVYGLYQRKGLELIKNVPNLPGWYLWARPKSIKREIYVGKSEEGLNNRFIDRFNQEYTVIWESVWGAHPLIEDAYKMFPQARYRGQIENYRCKCVSTHILWFAKNRLEMNEGEQVERELFQILDPLCNVKRPAPNGTFRHIADEIAQIFQQKLDELDK